MLVEDDGSDPSRLAAVVGDVASRCDLLLGPYSTRLLRAAARALDGPTLIWNHGGAGADVGAALPRRIVSVLTAAGRYAEPFLRRRALEGARTPLRVVHGPGSFGRQVATGAERLARDLGLDVTSAGAGDAAPFGAEASEWDLLSAGAFEDDVAIVARALARSRPPRTVCSVAAGVREFARAVAAHDGVLGVAQWFPDPGLRVELGPSQADFLAAYLTLTGAEPDYPAVQAAAGATIASHCANLAGATAPDALWSAAASLDTSTLFGGFRIDPETGAQTRHETVLVRWSGDTLQHEPAPLLDALKRR